MAPAQIGAVFERSCDHGDMSADRVRCGVQGTTGVAPPPLAVANLLSVALADA